MKSFTKIISLLVLIIVLASCTNKRNRQVQYMGNTDMYNPVAYETYGKNPVFKNDMEARLPVRGTIARGKMIYDDYPNSEEGYLMAKDSLKSPLKVTDENMAKGKYLFGIYCVVCHGNKGDGQGDLVKNDKFLGVPNYKDRVITEGSIYHVIMYGRNLMGSHASQLNATERWQVVQYVEKLRSDLLK